MALSNPDLVSDRDNATVTRREHGLPSYSVYGLPAPRPRKSRTIGFGIYT